MSLIGALAASLLLVPALYLLAGKSILFGKYPAAPILSRPDASELVLFLKSALPRGVTVHASPRIRAQLVFDFPTRALTDPAEPGEFYLFSLRPETMTQAELNAFRSALAADPTIAPITSANWNDLEYVIFAKLPSPRPPAPLPFLRLTTPEEFAALGPVVADGPDVEIRCRPRQDGTLIGARLKRRAESDLKFRFILGRGNERLTKEVTFANGLRPADSVETGTAFFVLLPPLEGGFPEQVQAEVLPL